MNKRTKHNLDGLSTSQIEMLIREWVHNRRDREILTLRLVDGLGYEEISNIVPLTTSQIKAISYKRIDELKQYCLESF